MHTMNFTHCSGLDHNKIRQKKVLVASHFHQNPAVVFIAGFATGIALLAVLTTNPTPHPVEVAAHHAGCPAANDSDIPVGGIGIRLMNRVELMP